MPMPGPHYNSPFPAPTNDRTTSFEKVFGPHEGFEVTTLKVLETPIRVPADVAADVRRAARVEHAERAKFDLPRKVGLADAPAKYNMNQELAEREKLLEAAKSQPLDAATRKARYEAGLALHAAINYGGLDHVPVKDPNPFKSY
jgi:hypothetical protein